MYSGVQHLTPRAEGRLSAEGDYCLCFQPLQVESIMQHRSRCQSHAQATCCSGEYSFRKLQRHSTTHTPHHTLITKPRTRAHWYLEQNCQAFLSCLNDVCNVPCHVLRLYILQMQSLDISNSSEQAAKHSAGLLRIRDVTSNKFDPKLQVSEQQHSIANQGTSNLTSPAAY